MLDEVTQIEIYNSEQQKTLFIRLNFVFYKTLRLPKKRFHDYTAFPIKNKLSSFRH